MSFAAAPARAADGPSSVAPSEATTSAKASGIPSNPEFVDEQNGSDLKLRAENGSMSRISMKGDLSYAGPSLGNLSAPNQPNIDGAVGNFAQTFGGNLSMRYRFNSDTTMSAGTGLSVNHPFHGMDRLNVADPFISADRAFRSGKLQMRNGATLIVATTPDYREVGEAGGLGYFNALVYDLGNSRFSASLDTSAYYWLFDRAYNLSSDGSAQQWFVNVLPTLKYNFNDDLNLYAALLYQWDNYRRSAGAFDLAQRTTIARFGLGYGIAKNVYFAPYLQSYVSNLSLETTSINISTIFSLL